MQQQARNKLPALPLDIPLQACLQLESSFFSVFNLLLSIPSPQRLLSLASCIFRQDGYKVAALLLLFFSVCLQFCCLPLWVIEKVGKLQQACCMFARSPIVGLLAVSSFLLCAYWVNVDNSQLIYIGKLCTHSSKIKLATILQYHSTVCTFFFPSLCYI